jgi:hypothetical protein
VLSPRPSCLGRLSISSVGACEIILVSRNFEPNASSHAWPMNMGEVALSSSQPGEPQGLKSTVKGRVQCNSSMGLGVLD